MQIVIIGSSGGIGAALCRHYAESPGTDTVFALSRTGGAPKHDKILTIPVDITNEESIVAAATDIAERGRPGYVIVASGILSDDNSLRPEKSYRQQSVAAFETVFAINTIGPALIAKHFLPIMPRQGRAVFAALSARVGSISDNRLGGWHAYRASKSALNMLIKNYALEQARRNPDFIVVGLHPGTVDTPLSEPFQSNVSPEKLFTPDMSAQYLSHVIAGLTGEESGRIFDWAGQEIAP